MGRQLRIGGEKSSLARTPEIAVKSKKLPGMPAMPWRVARHCPLAKRPQPFQPCVKTTVEPCAPAPGAQRIHSVTSGERLNGPVCRVVMTLAPFD